MSRHLILGALSLLSLVAGVLPFFFLGVSLEFTQLNALALFNLLGWWILSYHLVAKRSVLIELNNAVQSIGFPEGSGNIQEQFKSFLHNAQRYHTAAYGFRVEHNVTTQNLHANLRRIVELAFEVLPVSSAQLALSDEVTGLATQSMILGAPLAASSQELSVADGSSASRLKAARNTQAPVVKKASVTFAGHTFGTLWVEFRAGYTPTKADEQLLYLLGTQSALMLVDARFTDELLRMRKAGEESVRAKTGFLANLSHEIRGPLGIILNGAELILDGLCGPITETQHETLEMIKNNGDHLLDLVNDVLDYAKIEAGKITAKPVEIRVGEFADDLATVVRSQALAKKHSLVVEPIEPTLGALCDKRHARQMLINFLTNAIKYTPEGGKITLRAERVTGSRVKISVQDTGAGIPEDQKHKVFSAFERIDNNITRSQVGTGLGMPLTRRLAEVNNGHADFESKEGEGSTFWILLPALELAPEAATHSETNQTERALPQGRGETIMLVDHDIQTREMLGRYLAHQGFDVVEAKSGNDVLQVLRTKSVSIAIVENDMPDLSGEEMVTVIRGHPRAAVVPIILLSARAFVFDIERFLRLGVDRCLSKPVNLSELASTARRLIDETKEPPHPTH